MKLFSGVIFSIIIVFNAFSQTVVNTFEYAKNSYENGQYERTIELCNRVIYFDNSYSSDAGLLIADSYFSLKNWEQAATAYESAFTNQKNDSIKTEIVLKKAVCYLMAEKYLMAKSELLAIDDQNSNYFLSKRDLFLGIVYLKLGEINEGKASILNSFSIQKNIPEDSIKLGFKKLKKHERINPKVAKGLSMIVPGAGQFYNGNIKDGLNSFAINMAFAALFAYTGVTYSFFDAFISVFPWFQRYYSGGVKNAKNDAIQNKQQKLNEALVYFISLHNRGSNNH